MPKARLPVDTFVAALFRFSESARRGIGRPEECACHNCESPLLLLSFLRRGREGASPISAKPLILRWLQAEVNTGKALQFGKMHLQLSELHLQLSQLKVQLGKLQVRLRELQPQLTKLQVQSGEMHPQPAQLQARLNKLQLHLAEPQVQLSGLQPQSGQLR